MKLYGLIGYPLGHSFSVGYFSNKFENENITDSKYVNFPIESINDLPALLEDNPDLAGLNVTIPYKEKVIAYLDTLDDVSTEIGAVNTIKIENIDGKQSLTGYNTDAPGFLNSLTPFLTKEITSALILGSGGASKAISFALRSIGIESYRVSRTQGTADFVYGDLDRELINKNLLIINCSPIGTYPNINDCPDLPYNSLSKKHILFDLVYNPEITLFMKKGRERGAKVLNGYQMLVNQAEESWRIWNMKAL